MNIDLRGDVNAVTDSIKQRIETFEASSNAGPGEPGDPVRQITLGYQFDQAAWIALVFDTRPEVEAYDGEWQSFIEENLLDVDVEHWIAAYEILFAEEDSISITAVDGSKHELQPIDEASADEDAEEELTATLAEHFGAVLREALLACKAAGAFSNLPLADNCVIRIDEHEGHYGWPDFEARGGEEDEGRILG